MKRYMIECDQFYNVEAGEDSEGEWVRYEDVKALVSASYDLGYEDGKRVCDRLTSTTNKKEEL